LVEQETKLSATTVNGLRVFRSLVVLIALVVSGIATVFKIFEDPAQAKEALPVIAAIGGGIVGIFVVYLVTRFIIGLQQESRTYAHNISRRDGEENLRLKVGPIEFRSSKIFTPLREIADNEEPRAAATKEAEPAPIDTSNPSALFKVSRQRLLDEAVRIDAISRRNLGIGILFSSIALAVLAWPLVATVFLPSSEPVSAELNSWGILRMYLPRFSVGLLLQFVGFFFLRLYVANELDLKHNKNEITNLEMKMMAVQLAHEFKDPPSKKEIMKSLAQTERNFILKKNERSASSDSNSEYNDLRGLIEKLVSKIPGAKEK
jgi:hypothetical protein